MTAVSFCVLALLAMSVVLTLPLRNFWLFLVLFLGLFVAAGVGNGATYRMIPSIYRVRGLARGADVDESTNISTARKASAALGLISAVGAYGGFLIPQVLSAAKVNTGGYEAAFYGFVGFYLVSLLVCWAAYLRPGTVLAEHRV